MIHTAILCIGSNAEPREKRIAEALGRLKEIATVTRSSTIAESDDVTGRGAPYLNVVVECAVALEYKELLTRVGEIEKAGGRTEERSRIGIVDIDIDPVIWDWSIVSASDYRSSYFRSLYGQVRRD